MAEITDFGPRKTIFILAIVAGCFAVLWPKIFYPMLTASVTTHHTTTDSSACCEVIFESDVNAVDIMQEMCQNILRHHQVDPRVREALKSSKLSPQSANLCREEVLARCGIDLSSFLAERERLGKTYKQVLEEIRSFNSSLCLKVNFGVPLSQLGTPHLIRYHILMPHNAIRQERRTPPHAGGLHPALRERGRAIPPAHIVPKIVDRPDHVVPKMRPPLGGAGHVVPAPKGNGTMGIIMPLYTLGIVLFFLYTIVKVIKKNSDNEIISEYPSAAAEKEFRKMVFNPEILTTAMTGGSMHYQKESSPSMHTPAPTIEELKDLDGAPKYNGLAGVKHGSKEGTTGQETRSQEDEELEHMEHSPTVKVMGMEMTASCEGGQKCSRPTTPIIPAPVSQPEREMTPPKPIYLEGALPPQCELLVTDSETQAQKVEEDDAEAPVVLSGKMTLSLISLDQIAAESGDEGEKVGEAEKLEEGVSRSRRHSATSDSEEKKPDDGNVRVASNDEMDSKEEVKEQQTTIVMAEEQSVREAEVARMAPVTQDEKDERELPSIERMEAEGERKEQQEMEEEKEEEVGDEKEREERFKAIEADDEEDEEEEESDEEEVLLHRKNVTSHFNRRGDGQVLCEVHRKDELDSERAADEDDEEDEEEEEDDEEEEEEYEEEEDYEEEEEEDDDEDEHDGDDEDDEEEEDIEAEGEEEEEEHDEVELGTEEEEEDIEYDEEEEEEETEEEVDDLEESGSDEEDRKKILHSERVNTDRRK